MLGHTDLDKKIGTDMPSPVINPLDDSRDSKKFEGLEFANPKLMLIAAQPKIYPSQSAAQSSFLKRKAWLALYGNVLAIIISFLLLIIWTPDIHLFLIGIPAVLSLCLFFYITFPNYFRWRRQAKRHLLTAYGDFKDPRDPVLYLRPFSYDFVVDPESYSGTTDEELLASVFQAIGPVVSIGDPNEINNPEKSLPMIGTSRIFLKNDDWQNNVGQLMEISQLVVIHPGTSKGLRWEMGAAAKRAGPSKLLISFLCWYWLDYPTRQERYERFKAVAEEALNEPNLESKIRLPELIGDTLFLAFNEDWTPKLISVDVLKEPFYYFSFSTLLRETLRPVLEERGLKLSWQRTKRYIFLMCFICYGLVSPIMFAIAGDKLEAMLRWLRLGDEWDLPVIMILVVVPGFISYISLVIAHEWKAQRKASERRRGNV
jgi:hypothetical protein